MVRAKITVDTKTRIIAAHTRGEDYVEVARILGVKCGTAYSIVARNQANGGVPPRPRGGACSVRLDAEMQLKIVDIVEQHPEFTLAQVNCQFQTDLPLKPRIFIQTISKSLHDQLIVMKKMETVPQDRNRPNVVDARRAYTAWYLEVTNMEQLPKFIYVDESGFNLWTARTRGRARRGVRAVCVVNGQRGANFTLILAVSSQRGVIYSDFQGGTTQQKDSMDDCMPPLQQLAINRPSS